SELTGKSRRNGGFILHGIPACGSVTAGPEPREPVAPYTPALVAAAVRAGRGSGRIAGTTGGNEEPRMDTPRNTAPQPDARAEFLATVASRSHHGLRGDYSNMRDDYTVEQDYALYTPQQQDIWRRLYRRQHELLPGRACAAFASALARLDFADAIPRFDVVNEQLAAATNWQLVPVPGLLPDEVF